MCELCDAESRAEDRDLAPLRLVAKNVELATAFRVIATENGIEGITQEEETLYFPWEGSLTYVNGTGQKAFDLGVVTFEAAQELVDRAVADLKEISYEEAVAEREAVEARRADGPELPEGMPPELAELLAGLGGGRLG